MPLPENFEQFEVYVSGDAAEYAHNPSIYITDPSIYQETVTKAKKAMAEIGAHQVGFYLIGEAEGAGFLEDVEEFQDISTATHEYTFEDGTQCPAVMKHGMDYEVPWTAPMLRVYDHTTHLVWQAKHSDDECWIDLRLK
jgi:hypothetical protein